ncbi:MAG: hypothetical protein KDA93_13775 [Planctomycetaceae bacterium]|nr:hypothetical protein [Planctomycetaceae bacterium]
MTRPTRCFVTLALLLLPMTAIAQDGEEMTTRVYRVADLIRRVPDYPYQSGIPTTETANSKTMGITSDGKVTTGEGGGFGGGGGGFGGGGAGGGFFQIGGGGRFFGNQASNGAQSHELSLHGLMDVITTSIAPDSWRNSGTGDGTITALGTSLVVRQFPPIQEQIAELLAALREQSDAQKMVTIKLFVVSLLPTDQFSTLIHDAAKIRDDVGTREMVMSELQEQSSFTGQLTCFSGQEVHLASGHRRSVVTSAIPVVSAVAVGYQPVISNPHIGTLAQLTPTLDSTDNSATVDLRYTLTEWKNDGDTISIRSRSGAATDTKSGGEAPSSESSVEIQQLNIDTRQLATTIRVPATPAGETPIPVIVGTLGEPSRTDSNSSVAGTHESTYLIIAVSQADAE